MSTSFPSGLDSLSNPSASDAQSAPSHAGQHTDINDAMEAVQAKVGVNTSAVATSLDYLVKTAADPGHTHGAGSAPGGVGGTVSSMSDAIAAKAGNHWGSLQAYGATTFQGLGLMNGFAVAGSAGQANGPEGPRVTQTSGSVSGNTAYAAAGFNNVRMEMSPISFLCKFRSSDYTSIRMFVGISGAATVNTELGADASSNAKIGLQFSTARGDTTFQFVRHDGTSTQTLVNTAVTPVADTIYLLRMVSTSSTNLTFALISSAGASLATSTVTTLLPAATLDMGTTVGVATQTAATRNIGIYFVHQAVRVVGLP